jgi:leucine dehydrogenase
LRRLSEIRRNLNGRNIIQPKTWEWQPLIWVILQWNQTHWFDENRGGSGDPSPFTALGTYMGMKATAKKCMEVIA